MPHLHGDLLQGRGKIKSEKREKVEDEKITGRETTKLQRGKKNNSSGFITIDTEE